MEKYIPITYNLAIVAGLVFGPQNIFLQSPDNPGSLSMPRNTPLIIILYSSLKNIGI